jgi:phage terminase large subunit
VALRINALHIRNPTPHFMQCPHEFAEQRLKITPWSKITEIIEAVRSGKRKILVRSCHGAGKTTTIAALCNWKLSAFPDSLVLTTASSWTQVRRTLWGEIRKQARTAGLFEADQISMTGIKIDDKHFALGISPTIPENAQGFHAPHMLIAVDEATGVSRDIIDALWGNATANDAQMILIYNPISTDSFPFDAEASGDWHLITISAFDHPNVKEGRDIIPGAVTRQWIDDRLISWSYKIEKPALDSDPTALYVPWQNAWYRKTSIVASRICGEWPEDGGEGFILKELVTASYTVAHKPGRKAIGVDVARSGEDSTIIAFFDGNKQLPFECVRGKDLMRVANRLKQLYHEGWKVIAVDDTGIGGGVVDRLKEMNVPVHAVNFGAAPRNYIREKCMTNVRTELYFLLEEELRREQIALIDDRELLQELTSVQLRASKEKYLLESKEHLRKRLGRSPDKADATCLARYALRLNEHSPMFFA